MQNSRKGFTLIELLVVIAIIAILSVVVILTLNPAELLRQSRDSNRLSDLSTINESLNVYATDQSSASSFSMGTPSTTYISIPDPSATSTLGDQCQGLNLPALATGYSYHCAASSTYRLTNGTGWIPVNFSNISSGPPLGSLPVDPSNQSSSNLFYTYTTDGTKYLVTAIFESQKYKLQYASNPPILGYPEVAALGSNLSLSELYNTSGLVGYYNFDEGSGNTLNDLTTNNNKGTWVSGSTYGVGKVGSYSGSFNGTNSVNLPMALSTNLFNGQAFTVSAWINQSTLRNDEGIFYSNFVQLQDQDLHLVIRNGVPYMGFYGDDLSGGSASALNTWYYLVYTYAGTAGGNARAIYLNGVPIASGSSSGALNTAGATPSIGGLIGYIDDLHIYNRTLSAAEVQAMYNAEK